MKVVAADPADPNTSTHKLLLLTDRIQDAGELIFKKNKLRAFGFECLFSVFACNLNK
jgi:hypothetical protein